METSSSLGLKKFLYLKLDLFGNPIFTFRHPFISNEEREMIEVSLGKQSILPSLNRSVTASGDGEPVITISNDPISFKARIIAIFKAIFASIPYKAIFTSIPFWGIMIGHSCQMLGFYILLTKLPDFFSRIMHFSIAEVRYLGPSSIQTRVSERMSYEKSAILNQESCILSPILLLFWGRFGDKKE